MDKTKIIAAARYVARLLVALDGEESAPAMPEGVDARTVYSVAKRHSLASAVCYMVEDDVRASGDEELLGRYVKERDIDYIKNMRQEREFGALSAALEEKGIDFLPLKGFLFKALWRRPEYRSMSDMDIYVGEGGMAAASEVILSLGYKLDHATAAHDSFDKPPYSSIELHRSLEEGFDPELSAYPLREGCSSWHIMSDEDFLVYAIAHMFKHYKTGGSGMRSVFDIYLFLRAHEGELDADYVRSRLTALGLVEYYDLVLRLIAVWFGGGEDPELDAFELYTVTGGTYGSVENRVEYQMKGRSRISYIFSRIFLSYTQMKLIYPWLKYLPFLLPIAWVIRIFGALFNGRLKRELAATEAAEKKEKEGRDE
ncbi:MAG: nucleotidyltransferase family protein [Clostridia bacterium]|nr:nucleotidyltransferase family protein [Clostridia bacterium]